jgi:hypothetical protein
MKKADVSKLLENHNQERVTIFLDYMDKLAKDYKNKWFINKSDEWLASCFRQVEGEGLKFDGIAVSLQNIGVSYSYIAYKNKMLMCYPETILDIQIVYKDDTFKFEKKNGQVLYEHILNDVFNRNDKDVIGGYCIIKNKRGEFLTLLTKSELDKHRKVAKTDYIWKAWTVEMYFKTLIKKACKQHFQDIFTSIETIDNENNYDLDLPLGIDVKVKGEIETIIKVGDLEKYYHKNKEANRLHIKDFNKLISKQKTFILEAEKEESKMVEV